MKRFRRAIAVQLAALALGAPAYAADKLTVGDALSLLVGLRALDGHVVIIKQNGNDTAVNVPWEFGSGALRISIGRDIAALFPIEKQAEDARIAIVRELSASLPAGKTIEPSTAAFNSFQAQYRQVLAAPAGKLDLARIKASELRLDRNEIPGTILAGLAPILDMDVPAR